MKTQTQTLAAALRILANDIDSPDGVASAAILEATERNELAAQVEQLTEAFSERKAIALSAYEANARLVAERDALAAQVEAIKSALDAVRQTAKTSGFGVQSPQDAKENRLAWMRLNETLSATPSECLAQVKVEAVVRFAHNLASVFPRAVTTKNVFAYAENHVKSIREGEKP